MQAGDIAQFAQRPDGADADVGFRRGSAPIQYSKFAKTQYPVAANQIIAEPTKPVNKAHQRL
jgi:hypothetical protein